MDNDDTEQLNKVEGEDGVRDLMSLMLSVRKEMRSNRKNIHDGFKTEMKNLLSQKVEAYID